MTVKGSTQKLQLSTEHQRALGQLFVAGLLFWASMTTLLPTLPLYISDVGGSDWQVGIAMGTFAIGLVASRSWLGPLADRRGRKLVLQIGLVAATLAPIGYLLVSSIPAIVLIRAGHGISIAAFATAYVALVTDVAPAEFRGTVIGYMSLVNPIGLMVGPAIGGYALEWGGYSALFLLSASLGCIGWGLASRVPERSAVASLTSASDNRFWSLLAQPRLIAPSVTMLFVGLAFGVLTTFMPLFVRSGDFGINPGLFYLASSAVAFVMRVVVGRASDRWGRGLFVTAALVCMTTALLVLANAQSGRAILLAGGLHGAGFGVLIPTISALLADRSEPNERARLFGLCLTGFDVGIASAGFLFASLSETLGYSLLFTMAAAMVGVAATIFVTCSASSLAESIKFATGQVNDPYRLQHDANPKS
ncbi:MAG: MFS transporter [Cyanobacteria bacterium J06597_1]